MGKKVFVVPPQAVNVSVNVNVGQHAPSAGGAVPPQYAPASVNTAVHVVAGGSATSAPRAPREPFVPSFRMPTSDVLRRTIPALARPTQLGLGEHVHTSTCLEHGCALLSAPVPAKITARPWAAVGWLLVAVVVWLVQYSLLVPLVWLGAVAQSAGARALGWFAILLCGLGPFYSLFYVFSPAVPRQALSPWGLNAPPDRR